MEPADRKGPFASWVLAALCATLTLGTPTMAAAAPVSPLPESDYTTRNACATPAPGYAGCLALELLPRTSAAAAHTHPLGMSISRPIATASAAEGSYGLRPQDLRDAYFPAGNELPEAPASEPQTVALVDAYNDPSARSDLETYEREFGLEKCPATAGSCFEQVNEQGGSALPFPESEAARKTELGVCESRHRTREERESACGKVVEAEAWAVEISTDIEVTRAVCQNCKILLVEASAASFPDLETAEETAVRLGATEISNSWDGPQEGASGQAFDHPGTVITAAAGDDGYLNWTEAEAAEQARREKKQTAYFVGANYPASSPDVVAVGGTMLDLNDGVRQGETVWNEDPDAEGGNEGAGGSGCSESFAAPPWQRAVPDWSEVGCGSKRAVADVAADADPYTGVAVYDSVPTFQEGTNGELLNTRPEWAPIGGTSVASPIVAAMFALAGGAHGVQYPAQTLYSHLGSTSLHDVTVGGDGACDDEYTSCSGSIDPLSPLDCGEGVWICNASTGYDGPTGVGTPAAIDAFAPKQEAGKEAGPSIAPPGEGPGGTSKSGAGAGPVSPGGTATATGSSPGGVSGLAPARISALILTTYARDALRHSRLDSRLAISRLAFSCSLTRASSVKLKLAIRVGAAGRARWRTLNRSLTFAATQGVNRRRLPGRGVLAPGTYRLTLTPAGGAPRSLTIRVP
ncbi:MAG TPA: S8 family serine peptidase [Solirubrobacteraceae bacterium]|nr:S8 family serine peptidase [Solirubrobacteraceae bacterium]